MTTWKFIAIPARAGIRFQLVTIHQEIEQLTHHTLPHAK